MNKSVLFIFLFTISSCLILDREKYFFFLFQKFVKEYKKEYSSIEDFMNHYQNFINNLLYISKKNQKSNYKLGINKFSDLSLQEFRAKYANLNLNNRNKAQIKYKLYTPNRKNDEPESFNWVDEGVVNEIQDQGFCGSCWAFGTVSNIEGVYALKTGELLKLSEQQLVDCDENDLGCNGGDPINAFPYIQENGLELEKDYPYTGWDDTCKYDKSKAKVYITGYNKLNGTNEDDMKSWLLENGPLAVGINADTLLYYSSGILDDDEYSCPQEYEYLNHEVVVVGYGVENGVNYWIVRNSWGDYWGENGYFRIARGKGTCGINVDVVSATV